MRRIGIATATLLLLTATPLYGAALTLKAGTLGGGVDLTFTVGPHLATRLGAQAFSTTRELHEQDLRYTADIQLQTLSLIADWHPAATGFRLSAGAFANDNRVPLEATGRQTLNGREYDLTELGSITGEITFDSVAPYAGFGWGTAARDDGWSVALDVGVMFHGEPELTLEVRANDPDEVPPQFYEDLENERAATEEELSRYEYYPVVMLGVGYSF